MATLPKIEDVLAQIPYAPELLAAAVRDTHEICKVLVQIPGLGPHGIKTPYHEALFESARRRFAPRIEAKSWYTEKREQRLMLCHDNLRFLFNSTGPDLLRKGNLTNQCSDLGSQTLFDFTGGGATKSELFITLATQLDLTFASWPVTSLAIELDGRIESSVVLDLNAVSNTPIFTLVPQTSPAQSDAQDEQPATATVRLQAVARVDEDQE